MADHFRNPHPLAGQVGALTIKKVYLCPTVRNVRPFSISSPGTLVRLRAELVEDALTGLQPLPVLMAEVFDEDTGGVREFKHTVGKKWNWIPDTAIGMWEETGNPSWVSGYLYWEPFKHKVEND